MRGTRLRPADNQSHALIAVAKTRVHTRIIAGYRPECTWTLGAWHEELAQGLGMRRRAKLSEQCCAGITGQSRSMLRATLRRIVRVGHLRTT